MCLRLDNQLDRLKCTKITLKENNNKESEHHLYGLQVLASQFYMCGGIWLITKQSRSFHSPRIFGATVPRTGGSGAPEISSPFIIQNFYFVLNN